MSIHNDMSEIIVVENPSSSVATHINDKLGTISSSFPKPTIFKVHKMLRRENEMAYEPNVLAIGPYHRGKDRLQVMEDRKLRWFKSILEERGESDATKYVEAMRRLEPEARQCYSENTDDIKEDEFVEMLLLDACFIIQFMRWFPESNTSDTFFHDWIQINLIYDMLMFENQIPLFVVQELFSMIKLPQEPTHFHELALEFLTKWLGVRIRIPEGTLEIQLKSLGEILRIPDSISGSQSSPSHDNGIHHILGISHYILRSLAVNDENTYLDETAKAKWNLQLPKTAPVKFIINQLSRWRLFDRQDRNVGDLFDDRVKFESIPSAVKLHATGIKFKSKKAEGSPLEINFENGVMEISKFIVDDGTESLYRNLIAYEQYNQKSSNRCVSLHATFLDCLIDSVDDVQLLRSFGVVDNILGDDEAVSSMVNKLCHQVFVWNTDFKRQAKIFEEVNAYCEKRRHKWMGTLKIEYFNSPWALISFFAALFLLLLTLTQTIFSTLGGV